MSTQRPALWVRLADAARWLTRDWQADLDMSGAFARRAWWSWVLLALGAAALILAVDHLDALHTRQSEAAEEYKRLSRADRQLRLNRALAQQVMPNPSDVRTSGVAVVPALEAATIPAVWRMARLLAYPWTAHLGEVELQANTAQVVMLQLSVNLDDLDLSRSQRPDQPTAMRSHWQLQAAVKDDTTASTWVARLPHGEWQGRQPLRQAFTARAGTYGLQISASMQPEVRP